MINPSPDPSTPLPDDALEAPRPNVPRFCAWCGSPLTSAERGGAPRLVCTGCGRIAYRNPAVGVAVIIRDAAGGVLLGKRRGSYAGMWCIPCGYVEWDEDVRAAAREFREETGLEARLGAVVAVHSNFHNPAQHTVGVWFAGEVTGGRAEAADDLTEIAFFPLDALPEPLAFPTDWLVLAQLREAADG